MRTSSVQPSITSSANGGSAERVATPNAAGAALEASRRPARARRPLLLLAAVLLALLTLRICLVGLERPSLGHRDERVHVQAVQEMYQSGQWWLPTVNGQPYFHKPPFKMWLSMVPVALFGESTWSYRLIDGLAGCGTVLLVFILAARMFHTPLAGVVAAIALLGCSSYVFNHGVRTAVQDSMLIFLSTVALGTGFAVARRVERSLARGTELPRGTTLRAAIAGAAIGCGILTKSAAGFMPLIVLGAYALISGLLRPFLRRPFPFDLLRLAGALALPAFLIPAAYFIPHFLFTPRAYEVMIDQEVMDRATSGFHNQHMPFFYLERLGPDAAAVPPALLVLALLFGAVRTIRASDPRCRFLLTWIVVPITAFSLAPSRLTWYIAPTFPAMSVLIGGMAVSALVELRAHVTRLRATLGAAVLVLCIVSLGAHLTSVLTALDRMNAEPPILFERVIAEGLRQQATFIDYRFPPVSLREKTYYGMTRPRLISAEEPEQIAPSLQQGRVRVLTTPDRVPQLAERLPAPTGYRILPPHTDRRGAGVALSWDDAIPPGSPFTPVKTLIDFGDARLPELYGWGRRVGSPAKPTLHYLRGPAAAALIDGDSLRRQLGTKCTLNFGGYLEEETTFRVFLNQTEVFSAPLKAGDFHSAEFDIPPGKWETGKNVLAFVVDHPRAAELLENPRSFVAVNWLSIKLRVPDSENIRTPQAP